MVVADEYRRPPEPTFKPPTDSKERYELPDTVRAVVEAVAKEE